MLNARTALLSMATLLLEAQHVLAAPTPSGSASTSSVDDSPSSLPMNYGGLWMLLGIVGAIGCTICVAGGGSSTNGTYKYARFHNSAFRDNNQGSINLGSAAQKTNGEYRAPKI